MSAILVVLILLICTIQTIVAQPSRSLSLLTELQQDFLLSVAHGNISKGTKMPETSPLVLEELKNRTYNKFYYFQKHNLRNHQAVDMIYTKRYDTEDIVQYDDVGDSLFWTSHYITSVAHLYNSTNGNGDDSLTLFLAMKKYLEVIDMLSTLTTEEGYLARFAGATNDPYYEKYIEPPDKNAHVGAPPYTNLTWLGSESRDQYLGFALALASINKLVQKGSSSNNDNVGGVTDNDIKLLRQQNTLLIERVVDRLRLDYWFIVAPKGIKDLPVNPVPFFICALARLAINVNPSKYKSLEKVNDLWFGVSKKVGSWNLVSPFKSGYFSANLNAVSLYAYYLSENTDSSKRSDVLNAIRQLAVGGGSKHLQATFSAYYLAALKMLTVEERSAIDDNDGGNNDAQFAKDILIGLMLDFPDKWSIAKNNTLNPLYLPHHDNEYSNIALLPRDRPFDTYMWQRSPNELNGGSNTSTKEYQNVDAFLPYFIGTFAEVF
jgi:hypothetical protein